MLGCVVLIMHRCEVAVDITLGVSGPFDDWWLITLITLAGSVFMSHCIERRTV